MIVLDTHAWVWLLDDPRQIPRRARKAIDAAVDGRKLFVSSISVWEVSMLAARGRLQLNRDVADWLADAERVPFLQFVPVDNSIALKSVFLPSPLHGDPADRMIVATALSLRASLVTRDKKLADYPHVKTIW